MNVPFSFLEKSIVWSKNGRTRDEPAATLQKVDDVYGGAGPTLTIYQVNP